MPHLPSAQRGSAASLSQASSWPIARIIRLRQKGRSKEYFPSSKYGPASARVVNDGEPVPKGGGRELVGTSYSVAGKRYTPYNKPVGYTQVGLASWYGSAFHGRRTANGEVYDRHGISAAHPTMPLPAYARVTNMLNNRSMIVRVNDRGPFHSSRVMDLSQSAADALAFRHLGTARIKLEYLGQASLNGSDDKLLSRDASDGWQPGADPGHERGHHGCQQCARRTDAFSQAGPRRGSGRHGLSAARTPRPCRAGLCPAAGPASHVLAGGHPGVDGSLVTFDGNAGRNACSRRSAAAQPPLRS